MAKGGHERSMRALTNPTFFPYTIKNNGLTPNCHAFVEEILIFFKILILITKQKREDLKEKMMKKLTSRLLNIWVGK